MVATIPFIALASWLGSIHCSPLTGPATTVVDIETSTIAEASAAKSYPTNQHAFAVILTSVNEIVNSTDICQSYQEPLDQSDINENLALTYTLASELLAYTPAISDEKQTFDFLVFVDDGISLHQRRHLRQIDAKVHQIKAAAQLQDCPGRSLDCSNILSKEDSIRSSNDVDLADYEKIVVLDPYVLPSPQLLNVFSDRHARSLLSSHHTISETEHRTGNSLAIAVGEMTGSMDFWMLNWVQYLFELGTSRVGTTEPAEMFPQHENVVLRKAAFEDINQYATTGKLPSGEHTTWELCLD